MARRIRRIAFEQGFRFEDMNTKKVTEALDQQYEWKEFKFVVVGDKILDYIDFDNDSVKFFDIEVLEIVDNKIKCSKNLTESLSKSI